MYCLPGGRLSLPLPFVPWWGRLHASLMPDYNRRATALWWFVVLAGGAALAWRVVDVAQRSPWAWLPWPLFPPCRAPLPLPRAGPNLSASRGRP